MTRKGDNLKHMRVWRDAGRFMTVSSSAVPRSSTVPAADSLERRDQIYSVRQVLISYHIQLTFSEDTKYCIHDTVAILPASYLEIWALKFGPVKFSSVLLSLPSQCFVSTSEDALTSCFYIIYDLSFIASIAFDIIDL